MAYCTQSDVERAAGGAARLLQLADWDGDGILDEGVVDDHIAAAEAWINSYAAKKRRAPFVDDVPEIIRWTCAKEAVYLIAADRGMATELDRASHEDRQTWLSDLAAGRVSLGRDPETAEASASHGAEAGERESGDGGRDDYGGLW